MKTSKRYSFYSFKVYATKLLLQTPDGGTREMFVLEVWKFEFEKKKSIFTLYPINEEFQIINFRKNAHSTAKMDKNLGLGYVSAMHNMSTFGLEHFKVFLGTLPNIGS